MNIKQLNALSDYEINCAVADKLGVAWHCNPITSKQGDWVYSSTSKTGHHLKFYCDVPNHYIPIAIEHGIDIAFDEEFSREKVVVCDWDNGRYEPEMMPRSQTGRAVCIAFLLMNGE